ncbi:VOC family protein, partial [Streptomyces sp. SID7499]|nr:VOC family protein [Streptomyces sp. SID7499]
SVAAIGCFLLMSGPESELEVLRKVGATIAVKDVDEANAALTRAGARVIAGPVPTPAGRNLIALHPDGSVFEYVDRNVTV